MAKVTSLENLPFDDDENEERIKPTEPEGAELSTFVQWNEDVSGEVGSADKKLPRLAIGQKSGTLGEEKGYGNLVLNKEVVIAPYGQKLTGVTVIKIRKQYQERRPYDPGSTTLPKLFNTGKEAVAAGFSITYGDEKVALPIAQILFLIPAPGNLDKDALEQHFFYEFNGHNYAAAVFTTSATGYAETAKPIFTALDTPKVKELGPRALTWKAESFKKVNAKNSWFVLRVASGGFNSPEFIDFTKSILP
jgi:hypothetical protein